MDPEIISEIASAAQVVIDSFTGVGLQDEPVVGEARDLKKDCRQALKQKSDGRQSLPTLTQRLIALIDAATHAEIVAGDRAKESATNAFNLACNYGEIDQDQEADGMSLLREIYAESDGLKRVALARRMHGILRH